MNVNELYKRAHTFGEQNDNEQQQSPCNSSQCARQKFETFLKVQHLRTSALPRVQALSSNQTLNQDGVVSKERLPSSKVASRLQAQPPMNADLNMVGNETTNQYYLQQRRADDTILLHEGGHVRKNQSTLDLEMHNESTLQKGGNQTLQDLEMVPQPKLILNTSPTQPAPQQVVQIANQYQDNFSNHNWMSPRIIEQHGGPKQALPMGSVGNSYENPLKEQNEIITNEYGLHMPMHGHKHGSAGKVSISSGLSNAQGRAVGSMEGLHGTKINLVAQDHTKENQANRSKVEKQ